MYITNRGAVLVTTGRSLLRMTPVGGAAQPQLVAADKLPGIVNYFIGNNPKHWYTNIPTYAQVTYRNVYPGIDLTFHGQGQHLEYDWIVKPGADPSRIRLTAGTHTPSLDARGALHLGDLSLLETRPTIYQRSGSARHSIQGGYALDGGDTVRFRVGQYDRSRPLVIDPVLLFAQYLGGSGDDTSYGVRVDAKGNIYLTGYTKSTDFPARSSFQSTSHGGSDMFVMKLNSSGALLYSTYIGGSRSDEADAIAVDSAGRAYVAGWTQSADFPVLPRAAINRTAAVVLSLNPQGNALRYSLTYGAADYATAIALDAQGDAYAAVADDPTAKGSPSVLIVKIDRNGPGASGTTDGDLGLNGQGIPNGIAVMSNGNVVVAGSTSAPGFRTDKAVQPVYGGGLYDGFVAELDPNLNTVIFSTFLGGSQADTVTAVAVDSSNNIYVTGATNSTNFPSRVVFDEINAQSPFVTKYSADGKVVYSSVIGVPVASSSYAIVVNKQGYATIGGAADGSQYAMVNPLKGQGSFHGGGSDGFVATLGGAGQRILFSSYLGGNAADAHHRACHRRIRKSVRNRCHHIGKLSQNPRASIQCIRER